MRGLNGEMRGVNSTFETISAAATAIASAENRVPQASIQKRRWGNCWSIYWCFGSQKHTKRIGHSVLVPEPTPQGTEVPPAVNPTQSSTRVLPFIAPPSSPASFLQSEPPSATQSPTGLLSFTSISANMYSPGGPSSIFAIGPYAHETQLVSPPVFSTYTTEPSTAPFTPPPESVQLTTPSSPEVPFARLLDPNRQTGEAGQRFPLSNYEFYQLHPGSPVSHLISPCSGISGSGTSSPFTDREFTPGGTHFLEFRTGNPPKLLNLENLSPHEWRSRQGSGSLTPDAVGPRSRDALLERQHSDIAPLANSFHGWRNLESVVDHRVSFEITAEDVIRCVEKKPSVLAKVISASLKNAECDSERDENSSEMPNAHECRVDEEDGRQYQKHRSITLGSAKEFNFANVDGSNSNDKPIIGSDWWANEKVIAKEDPPSKNWSFFPMMQPGVS